MGSSRRRPLTPALFDLGEPEDEPVRAAALYASVAVNRPLRRLFTYSVPEHLEARVVVGSRVAVTFARRRHVAVVVGLDPTCDLPPGRVQPVLDVLDPEPVVGEELLGLTRWMAERYATSWGEALAAVLPAALKREAGVRQVAWIRAVPGTGPQRLAELEAKSPKQHRLLRFLQEVDGPVELRRVLRRLNLSESPARTLQRAGLVEITKDDAPLEEGEPRPGKPRERPRVLSGAQERALARIEAELEAGRHRTFLLAGVTGSGKTEVYLRAIERALALSKSAVMLVPEIALTPQTVSWFRSRLGEVSVLHSGLTDAQRHASWQRLRRGEVRVVVGARSAIFAPLERLGVIVVDEEHEPSFKQESVPRYHARDVAVERARRAGAVCILGSATPALESYERARSHDYELLSLPERVGGGAHPTVHVIDMRAEMRHGEKRPLFSRLLTTFLDETLAAKEQAILFLNRRGYVPVLWCPGCEQSLSCDQCDVGLTYHRRIHKLVCHSCCDERSVPSACPTCSRPGLRFLGVGSERVESLLRERWPAARVRRMDSDTMRRRQDYEDALSAFERHEVDVLVGTQMIAKGLDFPRVTLVGIVSADPALHLPDFRASERTFQLIAQVAGRAGRSELPGRVVVQTLAPRHAAIRHGALADYEAFAEEEAALRSELGYPPHGRLVRVLFEDEDQERGDRCAASFLAAMRADLPTGYRVLGPAPAPFAHLRGRTRRHLLVKAALDSPAFDGVVAWLAEAAAAETRTAVKVDVDPMSLL